VISITTKSPYALSALVELHRQGGDEPGRPVPLAELARRRDIPVQFLEQLFASLRRAGVVRSQRGVKGGYSLARPAETITVLELVEILDGPIGRDASGIFFTAAQAAGAVLSEATVASVAEQEAAAAGAPMYHI
jgi:Rrf2 family cysteine metabolism transcriptional repressor